MVYYKPLCRALRDVALHGPLEIRVPQRNHAKMKKKLSLQEYRAKRIAEFERRKVEERNLINGFKPYPLEENEFQKNVNRRYYEAEIKLSRALQKFRKAYYKKLIENQCTDPSSASFTVQRSIITAIRKSDFVQKVARADIEDVIEKEFIPYLDVEQPRAFVEKVNKERGTKLEEYQSSVEQNVALRGLLQQAAKDSFYIFVLLFAPLLMPEFKDSPFIKVICDKLQEVYETPNKRQQINLPPRAGKSKIGSILFPAWVYGKRPDWYVMHLCDTITSGSKFGGDIRDIIKLAEYKKVFPETVISDTASARDNWETTEKGVYRAIGANTGAAGKGGHLLIIDDLITEQSFRNEAFLDKLFDIWPHGYESRLMEGGRIVIINTRWSLRDLSGWLLDRAAKDSFLYQWDVLKIPAILDEKAAKLLNLPEGSSYCPERWPLTALEVVKRGMANPYWQATYMQNPVALDGNIIKVENFHRFPAGQPLKTNFIIASADTAYSIKTTADYSVIQIWAIVDNFKQDSQGNTFNVPSIALVDMVRGRYEYPDLLNKCAEVQEKFQPDVWLVEKKSSGYSLVQDMRRRGYFIHEFDPKGSDKVTRAVSVTPFIDAGRVMVPDIAWADPFENECRVFPRGAHDDTVDTFTQTVIYLRDSFAIDRYTGDKEEPAPTIEEQEDARSLEEITNKTTQKGYW